MRQCIKCFRDLDPNEFSSGTNWQWCKACKAEQVLIHKYRKKDPATLAAWAENPGRHRWFQDFVKHQVWRKRMLRVTAKSPKLRPPPNDWRLRALFAAQVLANWDDYVALCDQQRAEQKAAARIRYNTKRRQYLRDNPELVRAKERAKRARNPELYKAISAASAASSAFKRGRLPRGSTVALNLVWAAANGKCGICGQPCDKDWWHLDHIVPLSVGGEHSIENLAPAHPYCNLHKGNRLNDTLDIEWLHVTRPEWEAGDAANRLRNGGHAPCGTAQRYFKGCRCDACRSARNEHERNKRRGRITNNGRVAGVARLKSWLIFRFAHVECLLGESTARTSPRGEVATSLGSETGRP